MTGHPDTQKRRDAMVARQILARGVRDPAVLAAMHAVPREAFVGSDLAQAAYDDTPLPIGAGQTISQPYIVAQMIAAAQVAPGDRVLEVGGGSGYAAAVLATMGARVHSIERHAALAVAARQRLSALGHAAIEMRIADGSEGWPEAAPFDAILVAAAAPAIPRPLREQLAPGGRLVIPVGSAEVQTLVRITRAGDDRYARDELGEVRFVPLIGAHGWAAGP